MIGFHRAIATALGSILVFSWFDTAAAQESWRVDRRPLTEIAPLSPSGEVQLEYPVAATRLSNGTIAVGDARRATVAFFGPDGREIATAGRRGAGPGEFNGLWWVGQCAPDTVYAWDRANSRVTLIDSRGKFVRDQSPPAEQPVVARAVSATCARDGRFALVSLPTRMDPQQAIQRAPATVTVIDTRGRSSEVRRDIASSEFVVRGGGGVPRPLGFTTTAALTPGRIYVGTGDSAAVLAFGDDGRSFGSLRVPHATARPATSRQYELAIGELTVMVPPNAAPAVQKMLSELPRPERLPHYSSIHADPRGLLWLAQVAPGEPTRLIVVEPAGRTIGQVLLPVALQVWEVGEDHVLGQRYSADGEPIIVAYRFHRPAR
jgi:hypothetical protein